MASGAKPRFLLRLLDGASAALPVTACSLLAAFFGSKFGPNSHLRRTREGWATRHVKSTFSLTVEESHCYFPLDGKGETLGKQMDLLQGTLDLLILKATSLGPLHGYGILLRIGQISKDRLEIQQGSLYPALYRLEHQGWIASEWGESENKRKAKYYRLTAAGKRRLQAETEKWNRMTELIAGILHTKPEEV